MNAASRSDDERAAAATYIAGLTAGLADLAREHGLDELRYLLDMVRLEAEGCVKATAPGALKEEGPREVAPEGEGRAGEAAAPDPTREPPEGKSEE